MKPLDAPSKASVILSFDFDGTLHSPAEDPPVPTRFFEIIRELRESRGAIWGINTGRSMPQIVEGLLESRFPFLPDWVVAREREIFFPNAFGRWLPDERWNRRCEKEIHRLFRKSKKLLSGIRHQIEEHTGAQWIEMDGEPAGIIARTEEEMEWIAGRVELLASADTSLGWQRNSIYLRFGHRDFQKGSCLAEVARRFSLGPAETFAIGDSHNDIEMLDPAHAAMTACPSNAVDAIREKVGSQGGYLANAVHGTGAVEALSHYFRG